jgi:hypothetical protein
MNVCEAKDFVHQTAEQAALDSVPLSELEKRRTESDDSCKDPIALNEGFEGDVKSEEYEPKITRILKHARETDKE